MNTDLSGRRALVCGASQGIGLAAAQSLSALGASVTVVAREPDRLQQALTTLERSAGHDWLAADFAEPDRLVARVRERIEARGTFQILVNNTGGPPPGPVLEAEPRAFVDAFSRHLICNQLLVQALLPGMRAAGYGRVINIISTSVREPIVGLGVSNTIRGAVASWAKTLAMELGPEGVTVNNVLPGFTATGRLSSIIRGRAEKAGVSEDEMAAKMRSQVPLGRFADPCEVGDVIAFMASPAAAYVSGVSLAVDGGRTRSI